MINYSRKVCLYLKLYLYLPKSLEQSNDNLKYMAKSKYYKRKFL